VRLGLRTRVALAFAVLSIVVAGTVSAATYGFARWYLLSQRETAALTRASLDARAVDAALASDGEPGAALSEVPSVGTSQPMVRIGPEWYTSSVTVPPDELPPSLVEAGSGQGAKMRFEVGDEPYFAVALPVTTGLYVEVFPLRDLDRTLTLGGWILVGLTVLTGVMGAIIGATAAGQILGPVSRLGSGARRIASGELGTRIPLTGDADLDPIAESFNDMAEAVQARIARERRFAANVSHELRSPVTSVLGTAELLDAHRADLPDRESRLIGVLVQQVGRMARVLVDLLEISRLTSDDPPQWESADIGSLCREVVVQRGGDPRAVVGDRAVMRTDARRLERIVGNLVDNAMRHGDGLTEVRIQREPGECLIVVDDAGPGIDDAISERLFEPFARGPVGTDSGSEGHGAGLGLAIVREQARALGGDVTAGRGPSGGARFVVRLPVLEEGP
jgi:two-component system sensor histidine kinase MtrB